MSFPGNQVFGGNLARAQLGESRSEGNLPASRVISCHCGLQKRVARTGPVFSFVQTSLLNERIVNLSGRCAVPLQLKLNRSTGTRPGLRHPRHERCRAKGNTMELPAIVQG